MRKQWGVMIPVSEDELATSPRTSVDIRRDRVVEDAIREARKEKFDPTKLLSVSGRMYRYYNYVAYPGSQ